MRYDVVIAGAGLAGACAAITLAGERSVLVLEASTPGRGASGAAAGLVNPFLGRKARPAWRFEEALAALHALLDGADTSVLFQPHGVLRPAADAAQASVFRECAEAHPAHAAWRTPTMMRAEYPAVSAPHGALWIPAGGSLSIPALVHALLAGAEARGAIVRSGSPLLDWASDSEYCSVHTDRETVEARHLLLCLGDGFRHVPALAPLPLHRVKGQTVRLARPPDLPEGLPAVSGGVYIVPDGASVVVGATFEHDFADTQPCAAQSEALRVRASGLLPALAAAPILEARAGVRVTVPRAVSPQRLPLVGPLPGAQHVWVFTGLGAKGLLTAPLLARLLPQALDNPATLPNEVRPGWLAR